jgi:WD40 repeat protein
MFRLTLPLLLALPLPASAQEVPLPESLRLDDSGFMLPAQAARRLGSAAFRTPNGRGWTAEAPDGAVSFEVYNDPARWLVARDTKTGKIVWRNRDFDRHTQLTHPHAAGGKLRVIEKKDYQFRFVWLDAATGKLLERSGVFTVPKHAFAASDVAAGPSDRWLIGAHYVPVNTVGVEETETHSFLIDREGKRDPIALGHALGYGSARFRDDGKLIEAADTIDGKEVVRVWDVETGTVIPAPPPAPPVQPRTEPTFDPPGEASILHFSPDGRLHALFAGRVVVYDPATGKELARGQPLPAPGACCFSADGATVAVIHGHPRSVHWKSADVFVCDALTGRTRATIKPATDHLLGFALTADGKRLVTVSHVKLDAPGLAAEWDTTTGERLATWEDATGGYPPFHTSTSPDGRLRVYRDDKLYGSGVRQITVWDTTAKGGGRAIRGGYSQSIAFTEDGKRLVALRGDGVNVWDVARGVTTGEFKSADKAFQNRLAITPDGALAVTASNDSRLRVYDLKTGAVKQLVGHEGWIDSVAVSPDGKWLASSSAEAPIFVWRLR